MNPFLSRKSLCWALPSGVRETFVNSPRASGVKSSPTGEPFGRNKAPFPNTARNGARRFLVVIQIYSIGIESCKIFKKRLCLFLASVLCTLRARLNPLGQKEPYQKISLFRSLNYELSLRMVGSPDHDDVISATFVRSGTPHIVT